MEKLRVCFGCGKEIPRGGHAFRLHAQMAADFDGYVDGDRLSQEAAFDAMADGATRTAEQLMDGIYRERVFVLCSPCAERRWKRLTTPEVEAPQ